jgi:hypothetical protein
MMTDEPKPTKEASLATKLIIMAVVFGVMFFIFFMVGEKLGHWFFGG